MHPDPVDEPRLVIVYALAGFVLSVAFEAYVKRVGRRAGSNLVLAQVELWIVEGWLSLGVFIAFFLAVALSRTPTAEYSAYVDPAVCIVLSLILLRKPVEILKDSFADLVDANPYTETVNIVEESARARRALPPEGRPVGAGPQGRPPGVRPRVVPGESGRVVGGEGAGAPGRRRRDGQAQPGSRRLGAVPERVIRA